MGVRDAFGPAEEAGVPDNPTEIAARAALETLDLERTEASAEGGLDASDRTVHEMRPTGLEARRRGETAAMEARRRLVRRVARGGVHLPQPTLRRMEGARDITASELADTSRALAGTPAATDPS